MPSATLQVPPAPEYVRLARLVAGAAARRAGVPEESIDDVRLAVGEATARAVLRHSRSDVAEPVVLTLLDDGAEFAVEVRDAVGDAPGDPDDALALAILEAVPDRCEVGRVGDGDVIVLAWAL